MHQSKLIELLRKLSSRQISRLWEFLASPYFNKNKDNLLFFQYLRNYAPEFVHKNLSKETVLKKLKTTKPLDEKGLSYLMNQLQSLLKKFLSAEGLLHDDFKENLVLMKQFHELQLEKHYKSVRDKSLKLLENNPHRDANFYKDLSAYKRLEYEHSDLHKHKFNPFMQDAYDALTQYYMIEKLRYYLEMRNLEKMLSTTYQKPDLEMLEHAQQASNPAIRIYSKAIELTEGINANTCFFELKELLKAHGQTFPSTEIKQFFTLLLNYCTSRINRYNDKSFYTEYLDINKMLLEKGMLFEKGKLAPWRYNNLVTAGLRTGDQKWTWTFMHQYKDTLPKPYAESVFHYNLAQYYFKEKNYDKAQLALVQTEFKDPLFNPISRSLLIRIYYESGQEELLFSYLEASRIYLLRNKLIDPKLKKQMQKFIEFTTKLAKIDFVTAHKLPALKANLPPANEIMHYDWVLKQIEKKEEEL